MNINLVNVGKFFTDNGLWNKCFSSFNKSEITGLCRVILENTSSEEGLVMPYIKDGDLFFPFNCPQKYKYWAGEQSIVDTMIELQVPFAIAKKNFHRPSKPLTKKEWEEMCNSNQPPKTKG